MILELWQSLMLTAVKIAKFEKQFLYCCDLYFVILNLIIGVSYRWMVFFIDICIGVYC